MSIYIQGMEMPKSCPCELIGIGYDLSCSFTGGVAARVKEYYECCQNDTRPSWCPLIPVPEHGRLIDADAFSAKILEIVERQKYDDFYTKNLSVGAVLREVVNELKGAGPAGFSNAPTIIPADKEHA